MKLRLSDPAYNERLAAFLLDLGHRATAAAGAVELDREIAEDELALYLRVWSVLEPEITVNVDA